MSSSSISAGEAYVSITCNNTLLLKGLQEASRKISETAKNVSATAPSLSPKVELHGWNNMKLDLQDIRKEMEKTASSGKRLADRLVITSGDVYNALNGSLRKLTSLLGGVGRQFEFMSGRTGMSTSALSEYAHAASSCGADISNVESALMSMQTKIGDANAGMAEAQMAFERLGVDVASLSNMSPEEQFDTLARAVSSIINPTERAAAAMKVFGSDGQKLLPMFSSGADGLKQMREEARALGVSVDESAAKIGTEFIDATARFKSSLTGFGLSIGRQITPFITTAANAITRFSAAMTRLTKDHPLLTRGFVLTASAVVGFTGVVFLAQKAILAYTSAVRVARSAILTLRAAHAAAVAGGLFTAPVAGWIALGAAIAAAGLYLSQYLTDASSYKYQEEAQKALDEGKQSRSEDKANFERLKTLQEIEKTQGLTNEQVAEATRLATSLREKYGEIGVSVDTYGRKIIIASDAQARLNALMAEARKSQLKAAIEEAKANSEGDIIERDMAGKEMDWFERRWRTILGKGRNQTWGEWATSFEAVSAADLNKHLLKDDQEFQRKVAAKKASNAAQIKVWEAELEALVATAANPAKNALKADADILAQASTITSAFISAASEAEQSALDKRIDAIVEQRNRLIDELRKLADPNGEIDWNNAAQVERLFATNETARKLQNYALAVEEASNAQIQIERQREAEAKRREAEQEAAQKRQAAETAIASFERKRAEERQSDIEKRIDAIRRETQAYQEELETLIKLEEEKGEDADRKYIAALSQKQKVALVDSQQRENEAFSDVLEKNFERFATPFEKLTAAGKELQEALVAVQEAQLNGDRVIQASAISAMGEAYDKYSSLENAIEGIGDSIGKSVGGSFSLWQQQTSSTVNLNKAQYNEAKTQTSYLRQIAQKVGRGQASFN